MKKTIAALALATSALLAIPSAFGVEALTSLNVRSGPGTGFGVVDTLFQGEEVDVISCQSNGWCAIQHSGPDGYVSARYLSAEADVDADVVVIDDDDRDLSARSNVSITFGFGSGDGRMRDRRGDRDLVCLITFFRRDQVEAGADVNVRRAEVLSRRVAERLDGPNDRRAIFDYGTNRQTRETCRYLDRLN